MKNAADEKKSILIADDETDMLDILDSRLTSEGFRVYKASSGDEAYSKARDISPDLILLDILMPGMDGLAVKSKLNEDSSVSSIPVIFLTCRDDISDKLKGFEFGIDDYVTKPFDYRELMARIDSALLRRKYYEKISMTDALTGLFNMHYFKKQHAHLFSVARRYNTVFSLAMIDVDNLKEINDTYSHAVGDLVLKEIADILKWTTRESDIVIRYGGDEFTILFPETNHAEATRAVERIKERINGRSLFIKTRNVEIWTTVSIGLATYDPDCENEEKMFEEADRNMYLEKSGKKGRPADKQ